jgi:hypothetical protein
MISLRDRFAIMALKSLISRREILFENGAVLSDNLADNLAENAIKIADAMMKARGPQLLERPATTPRPVAPAAQGACPHQHDRITRKSTKPKASKGDIDEIIALKKKGLTNKQIAEKMNINGQSVNGILAVSRSGGGMIQRNPPSGDVQR